LIKIQFIDIDEQMVMSGHRFDDTSGGDAHIAQPELHREALRHADPVDRIMEIDLGARRRGRGPLRRR
jgi:hypothetical protein